MTSLVYTCWMQGGTGITNFDIKELDLYQEAVRQYGDMNLVVSDKPMPPLKVGGSLHRINADRSDLGQFWAIVKQLQIHGWPTGPAPTDPIKAYDRAMGIVGKK